MNATEAQIREAIPVARSEARRFFYPSGDRDEVLSDALYGLVLAAKAWDGSGTFAGFARICIRRKLGEGLRRTQRQTHMILTGALRHQVGEDGDHQSADEFIPDQKSDVHASLISREELKLIAQTIRFLAHDQRESLHRAVNDLPLTGKRDDNQRFLARQAVRKAVA